MKKIFTLAAAFFFAAAAFAQDDDVSSLIEKSTVAKNKKGLIVTPETGDIALGFDAVGFIRLAGNFIKIGDSAQVQDPVDFQESNTIYGRYFLDPTTAIRGRVSINTLNARNTTIIDSTGNRQEFTRSGQTEILVGGGLEKRRGYGRLQGFYGGEVALGLGSGINTKTKFIEEPPASDNLNADETNNGGGSFTFGVGGFVGVEYFVARKIALGAQYTLGMSWTRTGRGKITTTQSDGAGGPVETTEQTTGPVTSELTINPGVADLFVTFVF